MQQEILISSDVMGLFDRFRKGDAPGPGAVPVFPVFAVSPWEKGYRIRNRWEILDIKKGGMGIVYIVHDHQWNRKIALKTFQDRFLASEPVIQRFLVEAETWMKLGRHTNIVFAEFVEIIDGRPVLFLEYIETGDLSRFMGKLGIRAALDAAIQFCTGMEYAYRKFGIIHRDIKPGNVMVKKDPRFRSGYCFKVSDFGLVRALGPVPGPDIPDVTTGLGTSLFMPPEQYSDLDPKKTGAAGSVSTRSDIFSFGVTLYALLTGTLPFKNDAEVFNASPVPPGEIRPAIPGPLSSLILRCLEKDPGKRYAGFAELRAELIRIHDELFPEKYVVSGTAEELTNIDWLNRGASLGSLGKYEEALAYMEKSLAIDDSLPEAWSDKGNTLLNLSRVPEAMECFQKALVLSPGNATALGRMGIACARQGNYPEAIRWYDKALAINPESGEALNHKGISLGCLQKFPEALSCLDTALAINPRDTLVLKGKAALLMQMRKFFEAEQCLDRALAINPRDPKALCDKGMALMSRGVRQEALPYFDRALALNSGDFMAWYCKGTVLAALGKNEEAILCLENHIRLYPPGLVNAGVSATVQQAETMIRALRRA